MPNIYYNFTTEFVPGTMVRASSLNQQFAAIEAAFDEITVGSLGLAISMPVDFEGTTQIPINTYPEKVVWINADGNVDLLPIGDLLEVIADVEALNLPGYLKRDGSNTMDGPLVSVIPDTGDAAAYQRFRTNAGTQVWMERATATLMEHSIIADGGSYALTYYYTPAATRYNLMTADGNAGLIFWHPTGTGATDEVGGTTELGLRLASSHIIQIGEDPTSAIVAPQSSLALRQGGLLTDPDSLLYVKGYDSSVEQNRNWYNVPVTQYLMFACSDETTPLTTGTQKIKFRVPARWLLADILGSLNTPQASGTEVTIDVNRNGTSLFGATKLIFDNTEETTSTASQDPTPLGYTVILEPDDIITVDIDACDAGTAACGLKLTLVYYHVSPEYVDPTP